MEVELTVLKTITSVLPQIRGAGVIGNAIRKLYARKPRKLQRAKVLDFEMLLDPCECVDGGLLFYPKLYDARELSFMRETIKPGDVFLDIGANIGLYSLVASQLVGPNGAVHSIEADPNTANRLSEHIQMNGCHNVTVHQLGISDRPGMLSLAVNQVGNRGGSSFLAESSVKINVGCVTLQDFLATNQLQAVQMMKIDIEGMEFRVMNEFFGTTNRSFWPKYVIIEDNQNLYALAGGRIINTMQDVGYKLLKRCSSINAILELK